MERSSDLCMTPIRLERREPAHPRWGFYTIAVRRTLFASAAVVREWGRIGPPGTVWEAWVETTAATIEPAQLYKN